MKKIGLIVAAAAMFDLGTVVVASQAAEGVDLFLKLDKPASSRTVGGPVFTDHKSGKANTIFKFLKIDSVNTPQVCMAKGGTVEKRNGQQVCKTEEANSALQDVSTTR